MSHERKYKAFISYSHADKHWAQNIHLRLETFRTPKNLIGAQGLHGPIDGKLTPVFRDRDELPSGSALGPQLQSALTHSEFLIVLCSPAAANSRWVNEEITYFRKTHGDDRILAAIVDGEPGAPVGEGEAGCFPPALIEPPEGSDKPREPIAADFRGSGDGKRLAFQKLAAGMLGVGLDALVQRMAQRRQRRMAQAAVAMGALSIAMGGLAIYAFQQEAIADEQRAIAEKERDTATASLDYLVSIFEIANPATENPKTITALTILERGREKIDTELADSPEVQAKLLTAMGGVYYNLGELDNGQALLSQAIATPAGAKQDVAQAKLKLANIHRRKGNGPEALSLISDVKNTISENARDFEENETSMLLSEALMVEAYVAAYIDYDKAKAVSLMDNARDVILTSNGEHQRRLADINSAQGTLFADMGQPERARRPLNEARSGYRAIFGDEHVLVANTLHNIALAEFQAKNYETAAENSAAALEVYENVLEENHPSLGRGYMLLGRIENGVGDFPASARALKKASSIFKQAYGAESEYSAIALIYLAKFQAENARASDAFQSLDEAKRIYDALYPPDHANHGDLMVYRAIALKAAGNVDEAQENCRNGLEIMEKSIPAGDGWLVENRSICESL